MSLLQSVIDASWCPGNPSYDFYTQLLRASAHVASRRMPTVAMPPRIRVLEPVPPPVNSSTTSASPEKQSVKFANFVLKKPVIEKVFLTTQELLQPGMLDMYKKKGLVYLRRRHLTFRESLRNPTIGCHIELLRYQEPCSYHLDSVYARKLLRKLCY